MTEAIEHDAHLAAEEASPGVPGLRSWRSIYVIVLGFFVVWVVLLTALTFWYS